MWKRLRFSKPFGNTPIPFLDVPRKQCKPPLFSWTIEQQNEAALQIANKIYLYLQQKFTILCYYSSTVRDLKARKPDLTFYTVGLYTGKQTKVVFSLKNRSNKQLTEKTEGFFSDRSQFTVASTRSKEGVIILDGRRVSRNSPMQRDFFFELEKQLGSFFKMSLWAIRVVIILFFPRDCRRFHSKLSDITRIVKQLGQNL